MVLHAFLQLVNSVPMQRAQKRTGSEPSRCCRAIDAFQATGTVERVQAPARPKRAGLQDRVDALREAFFIESRDLGKPERSPVTLAAVLERPDQPATAIDDAPRGAGRSDIDEKRVPTMRMPGS